MSLPIVGSKELFAKLWKEHSEITEFTAKEHSKCDTCGKLKSMKDNIEKKTDPESIARRAAIHKAE
eukprot:2475754-Pleurochrysis_carterae.AAC.1